MFNLFIFYFPLLILLAFFDFSSCRLRPALTGYGVPRRSQFWPFNDVLRESWPPVTRNIGGTADCGNVPDEILKQKETKGAKNLEQY
jgi:hypothetical protein